MIYSPTTGVIGWLQQLGIPIDNPLVSVDTSLLGVLFVDMWSWWGYLTVIYFAGLRQADRSLIEAALVDGASRWQTFWHVLRPDPADRDVHAADERHLVVPGIRLDLRADRGRARLLQRGAGDARLQDRLPVVRGRARLRSIRCR